MKIVLADNDLGLVRRNALYGIAPFANRLDGGFDGFSAAVHGQHLAGMGQFTDFGNDYIII
jgi:hypothetical protein